MTDPHVLVVDDEPAVADGQAERLAEHYRVETAYGGRAALETIRSSEFDVVLLDRRMPNLDGDAVLERIRELPDPPRVAMVTGVEPDVDVVGMPFDDYVVKPANTTELRETVEGLLTRADYDEHLQEYFAVASKIAVLETERDPGSLAEYEEYERLQDRFDRLRCRLNERLDDLGAESYAVALGSRDRI